MKESAKRVMSRCDDLARISETDGKLTRRALGQAMRRAHGLVRSWMLEAGLHVEIDSVGNIFGSTNGNGEKPILLLGSHLDTVVNAGKYDGILGVVLALELVSEMNFSDLPFDVTVIGFSDEEGSRFQAKCVGSKSICGQLNETILTLRDENGICMRDAITDFGGNPENIFAPKYKSGEILGFIEFHIEQGVTLESNGFPIGIVDAIVGQTNIVVDYHGVAGHAGTLLMNQRSDSLLAAAKLVAAVERRALQTENMVATVGMIKNSPNVPNCVSGHTQVSIDVRHSIDAVRNAGAHDILGDAEGVAKAHGQEFTYEILGETASVACDAEIIDMLRKSVASIPHMQLSSGAGHDAMIMASICPVGMVFLRCKNGVSHNPLESVSEEDVAHAISVGEEFMSALAARLSSDR